MSERKERPIVFSGPMVRAILEGRKTQTRRVVKIPDGYRVIGPEANAWSRNHWAAGYVVVEHATDLSRPLKAIRCPYGEPGDWLWGKETWAVCNSLDDVRSAELPRHAPIICRASSLHPDDPSTLWRSPIHMPRWASRITLEVLTRRPERLGAISEADAKAEGVRGYPDGCFEDYLHGGRVGTAQASFRSLWERINGAGSWATDPLVWVVEFKPVEAAR